MTTATITDSAPQQAAAHARSASSIELALQRLVTTYIATGLLFLLLPGTFLGVWNLVSISGRHSLSGLSQAWLQAHGHAQIFGWIGTFIIGIGYYSLSKMGQLGPFALARGWWSWGLWTAGIGLRWWANVSEWNWRVLLPLSAVLQLAGYLIFLVTVSGHKTEAGPGSAAAPQSHTPRREPWVKLVMASTLAFLLALAANLGTCIALAVTAAHPEVPHGMNQRLLFLYAWGFPVLAVWGFNARWLPVFLGLRQPSGAGLMAALGAAAGGIGAALLGWFPAAAALLLAASVMAATALGIFARTSKPAKTLGVSPGFPLFVRLAYVWLLIAAGLSVYAAVADTSGGIWGASRHSLTVGFLATMVFAIGQRVLPAFCGMRVLYSTRLMTASLVTLNLGCLLRVASEIPAYERNLSLAWSVLPVSAVTELAAVALFALNIGMTLLQPPAHTMSAAREHAA